MLRWKRHGLLFVPGRQSDWMHSHAANPVAEHLHDDVFRIFFSCRDACNRSWIGFVELDIYHPQKILNVSETPILEPGCVGYFDDSGVSLGCILSVEDQRLLYYMGWNLGVTTPFRNSIGLAIWNAEQHSFEKYGNAPVLDRSNTDPISLSYPAVVLDGSKYKMWYGSTLECGTNTEDMVHVIKYADSTDGINWQCSGKICIDVECPRALGASRPAVIIGKDLYHMWYSYRDKGGPYALRYSKSEDGIVWKQHQQLDLNGSPGPWETEMQCYPYVFKHRGVLHILYCGNGYGKTGFGLAVLE